VCRWAWAAYGKDRRADGRWNGVVIVMLCHWAYPKIDRRRARRYADPFIAKENNHALISLFYGTLIYMYWLDTNGLRRNNNGISARRPHLLR